MLASSPVYNVEASLVIHKEAIPLVYKFLYFMQDGSLDFHLARESYLSSGGVSDDIIYFLCIPGKVTAVSLFDSLSPIS